MKFTHRLPCALCKTTRFASLLLIAAACTSPTSALANPPPDGLLSPSWQSPTSFPQKPGLFTTSFNLDNNPPNGNVDLATAVAIQSDGKVVVGGYAWNVEPLASHDQFACVIERYNTDGSLDITFGNQGQFRFNQPGVAGPQSNAVDCQIHSVNIEFDGKIFASGALFTPPAPFQLMLNTDGTPDTGFDGTGSSDDAEIAQTVQLNGGGQGVFSVGYGKSGSNTDTDFYYLVGGVDAPQDSGFVNVIASDPQNDAANAAVIEWNGGITKELYLVGTTTHPAQGSNPAYNSCAVVALRSFNGAPFALDPAFNDDGILVFDDPVPPFHEQVSSECNAAVARPGSGSAWNTGIIVGGERAAISSTRSVYLLAEIGADGTLTLHDAVTGGPSDPYFAEEGVGLRNAINAMAVQADGKLLIAGRAGTTAPGHGPSDMGLMRLNADFSKDTSFSPIPLSLDAAGANPDQIAYATAVALDPTRARAIVIGNRSWAYSASTGYDWMLGGVKDVQDRIFGDTFDGAPSWIY